MNPSPFSNAARALARRVLAAGAVSCAGLLAAAPSHAADFTGSGYPVGTIRSPDGRPCTFFTLVGVNQADPAVPNSPWFVISQSAVGYKEMLTLLLSAKMTGKPVYLSTSGNLVAACGQAEVIVVMMP